MIHNASPSFVLSLVLAVLAFWPAAAMADEPAEEAPTLAGALKNGDAKVTLRYRVEAVEDDGVASGKDATASTLRTTLSYASGDYRGWSLFLEGENVTAVGGEDLYRNAGAGSLSNGVTDRPVVADPEITEVNQAYLAFDRGGHHLKVGRQEINYGDVRHVGNVGWRQNHQSFDSLRYDNDQLDAVTFTYAYFENVNRIFGDNKPMSSHLLGAAFDAGPAGKARVFGLLLDYERTADAALSRTTIGAELVGSRRLSDAFKLLWEAEIAQQTDSGDNPANVDVGYLHLMAGGSFGQGDKPLTAKIGLEVLEGNRDDGRFLTPLATLHKFNGWADKFLNTPADGLEDLYLSVGGAAGPVSWTAIFHDFSAESSDRDFGQEFDLLLTAKLPCGASLGAKGAYYDADELAADTTKLMLWAGYSF